MVNNAVENEENEDAYYSIYTGYKLYNFPISIAKSNPK